MSCCIAHGLLWFLPLVTGAHRYSNPQTITLISLNAALRSLHVGFDGIFLLLPRFLPRRLTILPLHLGHHGPFGSRQAPFRAPVTRKGRSFQDFDPRLVWDAPSFLAHVSVRPCMRSIGSEADWVGSRSDSAETDLMCDCMYRLFHSIAQFAATIRLIPTNMLEANFHHSQS